MNITKKVISRSLDLNVFIVKFGTISGGFNLNPEGCDHHKCSKKKIFSLDLQRNGVLQINHLNEQRKKIKRGAYRREEYMLTV